MIKKLFGVKWFETNVF